MSYEVKKDRFFIPKVIKVGYQKRSDTYTGKLAYVIYIDHTGKVRKEQSWKSWRDNKINPNDFDNVPTEGFVLNKHVGGYKSGWDFRSSYCRIYDPRGFEFEITIDNLLWILDWEDCMHGKGLSGKFVYGWIYDQLTLIPCCTDDYTESKKLSDDMYAMNKMSKDELIPGSLYKIAAGVYSDVSDKLVYIGNLKTSQKLGKSYKSQLLFYDISKKETANTLIVIDKKNIKAKISDNVITEDELNDLIYRFNLSAYSYDFWKTTNIIEKFIPKYGCPPKKNYYDKTFKHTCAKIIDDTHVTLYKREYFYGKNNNYTYSYEKKERFYKFIDLDINLNITKICDFGKVNNQMNNYWYYRSYHSFDDLYLCKNKDKEDTATFENPCNYLYYITKDGYISDSLMQMLYNDCLSYVDNSSSYKYIKLPTKYVKEKENEN